MYAHVEASGSILNKETADKVLHHLQCAHRFTTIGNKWAQENDSCLTVIDLSFELTEGLIFWVMCILNIYIKQYLKSL